MSEIMLHGVLNMPPEIWNNDSPIDVMQRHGRYVQASKYIHELETELAAAREEIDMMGIRYAAAEMHHANNMQEVTEQRDRLAEALRKAISWGDSASHHILYRQNINWTYLNEAKEALQSLNQNAERTCADD